MGQREWLISNLNGGGNFELSFKYHCTQDRTEEQEATMAMYVQHEISITGGTNVLNSNNHKTHQQASVFNTVGVHQNPLNPIK